MFHPDYNYITDKLPVSIKDRAYQRLLNHSRKPIPQNQISEKNKQIEDYLYHTLEIYQKSLGRSRKTMDRKKPRPQSWPECLAPDNRSQNKSCDHRAEINDRALIVLQKQLLKYNKETFGQFMQNLTRDHEKRIKENNQL